MIRTIVMTHFLPWYIRQAVCNVVITHLSPAVWLSGKWHLLSLSSETIGEQVVHAPRPGRGPGHGRAISTVCRKKREVKKKSLFHKPININVVRIQAWSDSAPECSGRDKKYFYTLYLYISSFSIADRKKKIQGLVGLSISVISSYRICSGSNESDRADSTLCRRLNQDFGSRIDCAREIMKRAESWEQDYMR